MNSGKQEQDGESFITRHSAFMPHGDGWQGFSGGEVGVFSVLKSFSLKFVLIIIIYHKLREVSYLTDKGTTCEWISSETFPTGTNGVVIDDLAPRF